MPVRRLLVPAACVQSALAVTGHSKERLAAFVEAADAGERVLTLPGDASESGDVAAAVEAVLGRWGRLDAAVASAGFGETGGLAEGDPEVWRGMVLTNVLGPALLIRAALPALRAARGRIVLVGSVAGHVPTAGNLYGATKWAVTGMAENARRLVTGDGVGVTLVSPGRTETPF